jgi:hypothetical protein
MFFWPILCWSQSGNQPQEDLAKFTYKWDMEVIILKHLYCFATFEPGVDFWQFFLIHFGFWWLKYQISLHF